MSNLISKIIDFISKPINTIIIAAIFLTSLIIFSLNFMPEEILKRVHLLDFLINYSYMVLIVMVTSFFLFIVQGIPVISEWLKRRKIKKVIEKNQNELFEDPDALRILVYLYGGHPNPVKLPRNNQKVKLLSHFGLIVAVNSREVIEWYEDLNNPNVSYVLQPVAEKKLKGLELEEGHE